jgi:acetylornithine deacetylase/succinyl-diaminopimelate desuccinylase-like protein
MKRPLLPIVTAALLVTACAFVTPKTEPAAQPPEPIPHTQTGTAETDSADAAITAAPQTVHGAIARGHLETITEEIGARLAGTESETRAAHYIEDVLTDIGYDAEIQPFSKTGWVGEDETETIINSANVASVKTGESDQIIVVGAHYDSVDDGLGTDDNASGVAVLLEMAALLKDASTPYTIHFVAFGAEEVGLLGSQAYVEQLSKNELENTVAMINLDSVIAGDVAYVYSAEGDESIVRDWALDWAGRNGFGLQTIHNVDLNDEDGYGTADHDAFQKAGIPFAYFEATNWTLGNEDGYTQVDPAYGDEGAIIHTEFDRLDYLDEMFPGRVDERLALFTSVTEAILTQFDLSN